MKKSVVGLLWLGATLAGTSMPAAYAIDIKTNTLQYTNVPPFLPAGTSTTANTFRVTITTATGVITLNAPIPDVNRGGVFNLRDYMSGNGYNWDDNYWTSQVMSVGALTLSRWSYVPPPPTLVWESPTLPQVPATPVPFDISGSGTIFGSIIGISLGVGLKRLKSKKNISLKE